MPANMNKLLAEKEKIIAVIRSSGPSYPGRVARATGLPPLFVSAFLSELVAEKKLKLSNMKVGSSPLYFIGGQEKILENFAEHLNIREREAFTLLKESQILEDEKLSPVIRVALRNIKDFALPIVVKVDGETKLFWKYMLLSQDETKTKIEELILGKQKKKTEKKEKEVKEEKEEKKEIKIPIKKAQKPIRKETVSEFANYIKDYLSSKDIEILETLLENKKEFVSKIRTDEKFGKQEYLLISKDKKKISTNDITIALQKAQSEKMLALLVSPGELDKKAKEYLDLWKNLVKFERVKV